MSINRDATKQARGFSYQRQYCIYIFLLSIKHKNAIEIIEEGILDGFTYEDITLKNNNDEYVTYQIKYHTGQMRFNQSNDDLFKTIHNENNLQQKIKNVHFIVSKNKNTFDTVLTNWKERKISCSQFYKLIIELDKNNKPNDSHYKKCKCFLEKNKPDKIKYIDKIIIEEGYTYCELINKINELIQNIFNINDKLRIFYIKYYIFELLDNNWFNVNNPININNVYNILIQTIDNPEINNILVDESIDNFFKYIHRALNAENVINVKNIILELYDFINVYQEHFEIKHLIVFLNTVHLIYKKYSIHECISIYKKHKKIVCRYLFKKLNNNDIDKKLDNIISSISYYYNHSINHKIYIKKSIFNSVLTDNDKTYIEQFI